MLPIAGQTPGPMDGSGFFCGHLGVPPPRVIG